MSQLMNGSISYLGVSLDFGGDTPYQLTGFKRGTAAIRHSDSPFTRGDGRASGRAYKSAPTHSLTIAVIGDGVSRAEREASVREHLNVFERVWSADQLRDTPGELAKLTIGGKSAYGWPRELDPDDSGMWDGTVQLDLSFAAADDLWYEPVETTTVRLASTETGGLTFPAEAPFIFHTGPTERNGVITVRGVKPVFPVFVISGPILDPRVRVTGIGELRFSAALAADETLLVDTRPGRRRVMRGTVPEPGVLLAGGSRLSDMRVPLGPHEVILRGIDPTGTARLAVLVEPVSTSY